MRVFWKKGNGFNNGLKWADILSWNSVKWTLEQAGTESSERWRHRRTLPMENLIDEKSKYIGDHVTIAKSSIPSCMSSEISWTLSGPTIHVELLYSTKTARLQLQILNVKATI